MIHDFLITPLSISPKGGFWRSHYPHLTSACTQQRTRNPSLYWNFTAGNWWFVSV